MADSTYQSKPNLCTSSPNVAERGEPVNLAPSIRPSYLPVTPGSIPEDIKALGQWVSWKAEYQPNKIRKKSWRKIPKNPETGRNADPTARQTWGAFDLSMAYHVVVDRWSQLIRRPYHLEEEGLSPQGHVIPARGGLNHG
jgi:hypothetical protein